MPTRLPVWFKTPSPVSEDTNRVREVLAAYGLNTVCFNARCPNRGECYARGTATFMILGNICTRNCRFCAIMHGEPQPPDPEEPYRIAAAVTELGLHHVVITSVTRDDLADGGSKIYATTIRQIKNRNPKTRVEVLTPDFSGDRQAICNIISAQPDIFNHNLETVSRLYPVVRPAAIYQRSLWVLQTVKEEKSEILTKSGIMTGLGESFDEVLKVMDDLLAVGCDLLTIGQYLQPSREHLPVAEYIPPERFEEWRGIALSRGFKAVAAGPLIRSSFHAGDLMDDLFEMKIGN